MNQQSSSYAQLNELSLEELMFYAQNKIEWTGLEAALVARMQKLVGQLDFAHERLARSHETVAVLRGSLTDLEQQFQQLADQLGIPASPDEVAVEHLSKD